MEAIAVLIGFPRIATFCARRKRGRLRAIYFDGEGPRAFRRAVFRTALAKSMPRAEAPSSTRRSTPRRDQVRDAHRCGSDIGRRELERDPMVSTSPGVYDGDPA